MERMLTENDQIMSDNDLQDWAINMNINDSDWEWMDDNDVYKLMVTTAGNAYDGAYRIFRDGEEIEPELAFTMADAHRMRELMQ